MAGPACTGKLYPSSSAPRCLLPEGHRGKCAFRPAGAVDISMVKVTTAVDAAELALLREAAHRHVTLGHHDVCTRNLVGVERCKCGFDEARQALKEYGR